MTLDLRWTTINVFLMDASFPSIIQVLTALYSDLLGEAAYGGRASTAFALCFYGPSAR